MNYKHGQARCGQKSPEYTTWLNMKARCQNPKRPEYRYYGRRGIKVCDRWQDFRYFYADMGQRPGPNYSLDRIDNNGNYELDNCHWSTWHEQAINRRPSSRGPHRQRWFRAISPQGKVLESNNQHEIARVFGLNDGHISSCLHERLKTHHGWRFEWIKEAS